MAPPVLGNNDLVEVPIVLTVPAIPQPGEAFIELNDILQNPLPEIDLNQAVEEDLGGIEDLIQAADNLENADQMDDEIPGEVLDEGFFMEEEQVQENMHPVADNHVEVFIPDFHIQLGFVEIQGLDFDPVYLERISQIKHNSEALSLWARFFAPGASHSPVSIPKNWANFFTAMLINPKSFLWAKQLISSSA